MAGHQLLSGFLAKVHLSRVTRHLLLSVKGDNEIKPRVVHISPGIYLTAEEISVGKPSDEDCEISHRLKFGLLLINDVGGIVQHDREAEIERERRGERRDKYREQRDRERRKK